MDIVEKMWALLSKLYAPPGVPNYGYGPGYATGFEFSIAEVINRIKMTMEMSHKVNLRKQKI